MIVNVYNGIFILLNFMISSSSREALMSAISILMRYSCEVFMLSISNIDLEAKNVLMRIL